MRKPLATRPVNGANGANGQHPAKRRRGAVQNLVNQPGGRRGGRKRGVPNKVTRLLKEAILMAADQEGFDTHGKDGVVGWLRKLARNQPVAFAGLLGRVIPLQVVSDFARPVTIIDDAMELKEAAQAYADTVRSPLQIEQQPATDAEIVEQDDAPHSRTESS